MQCQDVHEDVSSFLSTISGIELWEDIGSRVEQPFNVLPLRLVAASMSMARTPCVFIWIRHVTGVVGCIIILSLGCFAHVHSCNATLPSFAWNLWVLQCFTQASMQFKIVIQRDSTQCNVALRWQYCQTVPCLLSAHFVSAPATKEMGNWLCTRFITIWRGWTILHSDHKAAKPSSSTLFGDRWIPVQVVILTESYSSELNKTEACRYYMNYVSHRVNSCVPCFGHCALALQMSSFCRHSDMLEQVEDSVGEDMDDFNWDAAWLYSGNLFSLSCFPVCYCGFGMLLPVFLSHRNLFTWGGQLGATRHVLSHLVTSCHDWRNLREKSRHSRYF